MFTLALLHGEMKLLFLKIWQRLHRKLFLFFLAAWRKSEALALRRRTKTTTTTTTAAASRRTLMRTMWARRTGKEVGMFYTENSIHIAVAVVLQVLWSIINWSRFLSLLFFRLLCFESVGGGGLLTRWVQWWSLVLVLLFVDVGVAFFSSYSFCCSWQLWWLLRSNGNQQQQQLMRRMLKTRIWRIWKTWRMRRKGVAEQQLQSLGERCWWISTIGLWTRC